MPDAEHEEITPDAETLFITKLSCSLVGVTERIRLTPGTRTQRAYGREEAAEGFRCSYGLNPEYRNLLKDRGLVAGVGPNGEIRIIELPNHPFFVAALFVPQFPPR